MRIGIDAHMLGDHSGGNESFYSGILRALIPDPGDEYVLFMKPGVDDSEYRDGFRIVRFRSKNAFVRNFVELPFLAVKYRLDVLHTQYYIPFIRPCPVVCTIHDICFEHFRDIFTKGEYIRNKILIPYAAKHSARIVTVSEFSKRDIADCYGVPSDKIEVIYNAVDSIFRRMTDEELTRINVRKKFGIGDEPYIICVGNLQPRKNIPRLIEAYSMYIKMHPDSRLKLVIVGKKAWMYEDILRKVRAESGDIVLTGYVERVDLVALLNEAKGFVYPSIFEGFGIPPLEALACGTPVAVSDIEVMHEVLGDVARYFDPYDVEDLEKAIEGFVPLDGEGREGAFQNICERYSWGESAERIKRVYRGGL
ncbi:Glycosyltransferase involved in cell wall bisynthesis [Lachnospiraceae bacterium]|nr:Glycosyltransferase involved in cell wall bisynthesis [Lachnospiraceae bacterium]